MPRPNYVQALWMNDPWFNEQIDFKSEKNTIANVHAFKFYFDMMWATFKHVGHFDFYLVKKM